MRRGLVAGVVAGVLALGAGAVALTTVAGGDSGACLSGELPPAPPADGEVLPAGPAAESSGPEAYEVEVLARYPHDTDAFTQGLVVHEGLLMEGTGGYGSSDVRAADLGTGEVVARQGLPGREFGEGLAQQGDRLFQLTWQDRQGYTRDACTLDVVDEFTYDGEGWGLASDGEVLWRSDGTATLTAHDPESLEVVRTVQVADRGSPVPRLNELEVVGGELLANVWLTDLIARIDLDSGTVTGWIDAAALAEEVGPTDPDDVLNGIAATDDGRRLWLTGKRWPTVFEVRVVPGGDLPPVGGRS
ncbi:MAG TPA: glutaminyl-peptide cyclotransferase [Jiangellales bacterium]|nr:glutaminyl-peptide cyclotransferase [Jiangellales bacterium]